MSLQVLISAKPVVLHATLIFYHPDKAPEEIWECEHAHSTYDETTACGQTQIAHMLEMVKP
jgi:hypothetical protein